MGDWWNHSHNLQPSRAITRDYVVPPPGRTGAVQINSAPRTWSVLDSMETGSMEKTLIKSCRVRMWIWQWEEKLMDWIEKERKHTVCSIRNTQRIYMNTEGCMWTSKKRKREAIRLKQYGLWRRETHDYLYLCWGRKLHISGKQEKQRLIKSLCDGGYAWTDRGMSYQCQWKPVYLSIVGKQIRSMPTTPDRGKKPNTINQMSLQGYNPFYQSAVWTKGLSSFTY